jgi:LDH2 family malate/lactate/ureidoglycolate dehydrogenase
MATIHKEAEEVVIPLDELRAFCVRALVKAGSDPDHAHALAELLVAADWRGHFSHGLNRLG